MNIFWQGLKCLKIRMSIWKSNLMKIKEIT